MYAEGEGLSSPDDFEQVPSAASEDGKALQYIWYNQALMKQALCANDSYRAPELVRAHAGRQAGRAECF